MITKNAYLRYKTLDKCFSNFGKTYFANDLLEEVNRALAEDDSKNTGINKRQLYYDIAFMESEKGWAIDLKKTHYGAKVAYRYADRNFSINNQPLNRDEAENIKAAIEVMSRFSGAPEFDWVNEILPQLESRFGLQINHSNIISFDDNFDYSGKKWIGQIYKSIQNKQALSINYKDFKSDSAYKIVFHPYFLKQYNNRWFAFGLNEETQIPSWNLALDRIKSIEQNASKYIDSEIDWDDYFYDIVGVTRKPGEEAQEIKLLFDNEIMPYIQTKPIHPSQKEKVVKNGLEIRLKLIPNYEFKSLLLSYGSKVKVVLPEKLRLEINNEHKSYCQNDN